MSLPKRIFHHLKSMRIQVLIVVLFIGLFPVFLFSEYIISSFEDQLIEQKIIEVSDEGKKIARNLASSGYMTQAAGADLSSVDTRLNQVAEIYNGRVIVVDSYCRIIKDTFDGLEEGMTLVSKEVLKGISGEENVYRDSQNDYLECTVPVSNQDGKIIGAIVLNVSSKIIGSAKKEIRNIFLLMFFIALILIVVFGIVYTNLLIKPFKEVSKSLDQMAEGAMGTIELNHYSELNMITGSINHLLARLSKLEASRQEFVSNVSHELKTPITSMKVLADSLLMQEGVPEEIYREFLSDINAEIEREDKIINDLLSLVKMDKTTAALNIESVSINDLLDVILKRLHPIAQSRNIELIYESFRPVTAEIDEVKLSLAINNLIENAIKYNYDDGWVRVSLNADHKFFYIKVSDSGVGIPEDCKDSIFERFYRVDKARSRDTGGTGLGLAITRNAIVLHRGSIKVYSKEHEGTTFSVRIPLNYIA